MSTLGRNIAFPIYNGNGTPFHNLVMRKSTSDSVVMSLSDKVTGDVYYKDNTLTFNMDEYILLDGVKFVLVNPPTIVREGLKSDNGELKGMTKYSLEFYHPMYMLGNLPFTDVAVNSGESIYKSHDRSFAWVGNLTDYVAKLNKNLQGTQFVVSISNSIDSASRAILSDVLSFNDNTIADALKTGYDTWHFPFVVDAIKSGEPYYADGKRFLIQFGNPTREILDANNEPFVFQFGKGVGLKNNSRTPKNNKIVTRVAGYGSEQNIPYGYPQIPWTGDASATQTLDGYPIYDGIVGGVVTKLIKHPFTRTHLMPSVYVECVRKKVNSAAEDYDPTIELVDYYDAPSTYPNPINLDSPKYDIVQIDSIKPELGDMTIVGAEPVNDDLTPASGWDDTMDDDGKYKQSYFKLTIPQLDFDVYACASITEEMKINMRSGACIGCTFDVQVDWDDYKENFFDEEGNFLPDGEQRDLNKYPKSNLGNITLVCKKDINTFGTLMPNVYQYPRSNDMFVILGISLPNTYITNAQVRLDDAIMAHMLDNNVYYYDYPLKFDEDFLLNHTNILSQIRTNTVLRFMFGNLEKSLYVKQITIKYGDGVLPKYDITLTDNIEVVLNQIGLVADDVSRLALAMMQMNKRVNINMLNNESLENYVNYTVMPNLERIESQVDGMQVTYFGTQVPTLNNYPANTWTDALSEHVDDMYYNRTTGKGYAFSSRQEGGTTVYYWSLIQDEDIVQALADASAAQDTADGKRRVFITSAGTLPNPPYDQGDLWVNATYPQNNTSTDESQHKYYNDILKCVTPKASEGTASINDWSLSSKYTDDSSLNAFISGTYAQNLQNIQTQIDGKAETWYQSTDPSIAWTTPALETAHKGDIWHNSSSSTINGVKAGQDAIWNGTAWVVDETVPQEVYDKIDGKCAIYVSWNAWMSGTTNNLEVKDLFIPASDTTQGGVTYKANKVYRCTNASTPTFQEILYTDDTTVNAIISQYGSIMGVTPTASGVGEALGYLRQVLGGSVSVDGGLILSNLIAMRDTEATPNIWGGISGIYKSSETGTTWKGHGVAAWFGGAMVDKEVETSATNYAKSLFRMDGSGYVAGGNLTWDKSGNVTIQGYSINATTLQVGGSNVATQSALANYVTLATTQTISGAKTFSSLLTANGITLTTTKKITFGSGSSAPYIEVDSNGYFHFSAGLYSDSFVSALGVNTSGGGGAGIDLDAMWGSLMNTISDTYASSKIAAAHIPTATSSAIGGIKVGYTTSNKNYKVQLDSNSNAYVNVPWTDTTYTLAGLMGSSSIGGSTTPVYWTGSAWASCTAYADASVKNSNHINRSGYISNTSYATVGAAKTAITALIALQEIGIGDNITVNASIILQWNNDSATTYDSSWYSMIKIGGAYSGSQYGQWLLSGYSSNSIGVVGRDGNQWGSIRWLAEANGSNATGTWGINITGNAATATSATSATSATTASKLSTVSKTAWGQTYWTSGGVPTSISGNMSDVGSISASGDLTISKTTTQDAIAQVGNANGTVGLYASTNRGVYDITKSTWIVGTDGTNTWMSQGNVGIGTTSPASKLVVDGTHNTNIWAAQIYSSRSYVSMALNYGSGISVISQRDTSDYYLLNCVYGYTPNVSSGTSAFYVGCDGNVGVGTTTPSYTLHVAGSIGASSTIRSDVAQGTAPFSCSSTTLCANLNANYLSGASSSDFGRRKDLGYLSDYGRIVIGLCKLYASGNSTESASFGRVELVRTNGYGLTMMWADVHMQTGYAKNYGFYYKMYTNLVNTSTAAVAGQGFRPCRFIYNGQYYGGLEFYYTAQGGEVYFHGEFRGITPFIVTYYKTNTGVQNSEIYNSLTYGDSSNGTVSEGCFYSQSIGAISNITAGGEITASSDARQKTLISDTNLSVSQIANAPNVLYRWNDNRDNKVHGGSLAQYWDNGVAPWAVSKDDKGYMSLSYGALALCSAISIARGLLKVDDRVTKLEKENKKLKSKISKQQRTISELLDKVDELEKRVA